MSESDDRMERAERIRRMRESREPGPSDAETSEPGPSDTETSEPGPSDTETSEPGPSDAETTDVEAETAEDDPGQPVEPGDPSEESTADSTSANDPASDGGTGTETPSEPAAAAAGVAPLGGSGDFSLPDQAEMAAAMGTDSKPEPGDAASSGAEVAGHGVGHAAGASEGTVGGRGESTAATEASVRVLEFTVGEQVYCIDIERVEEIVEREAITRVPNTAEYVEGVLDLRGQITTILDTGRLLDVEDVGSQRLLVIFAPDAFEEHGTVGWVVDQVRQVVPVTDSQIRTPPSEQTHVRSVVDREGEDELVVWIRPGAAMTDAVDGDE